MSDKEGQTKVLRSKVERVEREKRELQMRISQSSQGGMAAFQAQELQRQLDVARQNLAHKEQEVLYLHTDARACTGYGDSHSQCFPHVVYTGEEACVAAHMISRKRPSVQAYSRY